MREAVKGFHVVRENDVSKILESEVDVTVSRATGVWLVDGKDDMDATSFRMIVGQRDEQGAARAYAAHRKAHGFVAAALYRLFPLLSAEPIDESQLGNLPEAVWSAFSDAWVEVRL